MIPVADLLATARKWIDTPVLESGAVCQVGCNCMGFAAGVARDLGLDNLWKAFEPHQGKAKPDGPRGLLFALQRHLIKVDKIQPGCLLLIQEGESASHVGIATESGLIEARTYPPIVKETSRAGRQIVRIYQVPGVKYV